MNTSIARLQTTKFCNFYSDTEGHEGKSSSVYRFHCFFDSQIQTWCKFCQTPNHKAKKVVLLETAESLDGSFTIDRKGEGGAFVTSQGHPSPKKFARFFSVKLNFGRLLKQENIIFFKKKLYDGFKLTTNYHIT